MSDEEKAQMTADNKEYLEKSKQMQAEAERIAEESLMPSCIVLGVLAQRKGVRTKVVGYDGSLYEIVGMMEEFLADFRNGALTEWIDVDEDGETLEEAEDGEFKP